MVPCMAPATSGSCWCHPVPTVTPKVSVLPIARENKHLERAARVKAHETGEGSEQNREARVYSRTIGSRKGSRPPLTPRFHQT